MVILDRFIDMKKYRYKLFYPFLALQFLLATAGVASCSDKRDKAGECRRSHNVKCLADLYLEDRSKGDETGMLFYIKAIGETGGADSENELMELYKSGNPIEKKRILAELVDMKSNLAVPELLNNLLNTLQTGGDGEREAEIIERLEPGSIEKELNGMLAKSEAARLEKSLFGAEQYMENANALAKLVKGKNPIVYQSAIEALKKEKRIAEIKGSILEAMENGRLSEAYKYSQNYYDLTSNKQMEILLPELKILSDFEGNFYLVALNQENARNRYIKAKSDNASLEDLKKLKDILNTEKGNMVIIRRNLERARKKLPELTDKIKSALMLDEKH